MKSNKSAIQPDGSVLRKFWRVDHTKFPNNNSRIHQTTEWLKEVPKSPRHITDNRGNKIDQYYYDSKRQADLHFGYIGKHGKNTDEKLKWL